MGLPKVAPPPPPLASFIWFFAIFLGYRGQNGKWRVALCSVCQASSFEYPQAILWRNLSPPPTRSPLQGGGSTEHLRSCSKLFCRQIRVL